MKWHVAVVILGLLIVKCEVSFQVHRPRVAIIGGGIGGTSASHFLSQLLQKKLDIDLYEEMDRFGGRLATVNLDIRSLDKSGLATVEAGGAVIHPKNMYMQNFVKSLGLEKLEPSTQKNGLWDGDQFVYQDSNYYIVSLAKLFHRYGFQPLELKWYVDNILEDFGKIYSLQNAGQSFENVTALLSAMNKEFPKLLDVSIKNHLLQKGFTNRFIDEIVQAATVVNYGQETNIQSFVGLVALAGVDANLWSVKGGNKKVPQFIMMRNKHVNVILGRVTKIRHIAKANVKKEYEVTYVERDSTKPTTSYYDSVIVAVPLTKDQKFQIEFINFDLRFPGNYQTTYATFVKASALNPGYFGLQESLDTILSCNPNKTKISFIGKVNSVEGLPDGEDWKIWKIFSRQSLNNSLIDDMFLNITDKKEIVWKAYPRYSIKGISDFKLHDAVYYVNAIEWAASAMEMSIIGARNVAILAYNDFIRKYNYTSNKDTKQRTKQAVITDEL